ncbi:hypothetical protein [Halocola ammonii]
MKKNLLLLGILVLLAALSGVAYWLSDSGSSTLSSNPLTDFAIEDTSTVTKIFITDKSGASVTLEREKGDVLWDLNGKYLAREDATTLLLKTFDRIKVKSPVPEPAKETVLKIISGSGKKVEIYQNYEEEPSKIYYVGSATPDHFGTYMILEIPGEGRSPEPFITHMEGFSGHLASRFFTDEMDWRFTGVFNYPDLNISKIDVRNHERPAQSFRIDYGSGNDIKLYHTMSDQYVENFDTSAVKNYMLLYKKVHAESFMNYLSEAQEDSLLNTVPAYTVRVTDKSGQAKKIDLYNKPSVKEQYLPNGELAEYDLDRMYGHIKGREIVVVQRFVFDPLLQNIASFIPQELPS